MKKSRALSFLYFTLSVLLAGGTLPAATVSPAPAAGDVFLGVRASDGQGSGTSLIVNVGNESAFRGATAGTVLSLANVGADLVATYGSNWATRADLNWGFFGSRNDVNPVVYGSRAQSPYGSSVAAFPVLPVDSRASTNTQIVSVIQAYSQLDAASGPKSALQTNKAEASSYNYQVATEGVTDFGTLSRWTTIEGNFALGASRSALDLFRYAGNSSTGDTVTRLGSFSITPDGALSFLAGPVIDQVQVASATATAQEDAGSVTLNFVRFGDHNENAISATFSITDGTAASGIDYTAPASLTVNFAANVTSQSVVVPLINRAGYHGDRTFTVTLASATGGYVVATPSATVVTITDADADPGAIDFTAASFLASVLDSSVQITLERTSGVGAVSVNVSATGGTLVNGVGYSFTSPAVVSFADGVTSASTSISLSTTAAGTIQLGLSNPTNFARLGTQTTATVNVAGSPGVLAFGANKYSFNESAGTVNIPIVRTTGLQGQVTVTVNSANGTAQAPSDYAAISNYTATLNDGQSSVNVPVTLFNTQPGETNETFTLNLSAPTGGATLGAVASTTIRILELDTKIPTVALTAPAASARILATAGPTVALTGSATDDKGLDRVEVQLNGGAWLAASLTANATATIATFSKTITPVAGLNTLNIRSVDGTGNISTILSRSFTYVVASTLTVNIVNSPAGSGTLPTPFPGVDSNREVGKTYTIVAKPATNFVFAGWTGTGISGPLAELPSLTFVQTANQVLNAKFIANPFVPSVIGDFNGLITATGSTTPGQDTNGFINVKVLPAGTFTGTLKIDGLSVSIAGAFNTAGDSRFGAARSSTLIVPRTGKPSYVLALKLDLDATVTGTNKVTGTLGVQERSSVTPLSVVDADRARYSSTDKVPAINQGLYTVVIPAKSQSAGSVLDSSDYPQGDGIGSITVTAAGVATLTGTLADGTVVTASAPLSKINTVPLFAQLYTKGGSFGGQVTVDAAQADSDLAVTSGTNFFWFRPYQSGQYYPFGWLEGVVTGFVGAKYTTPVNASAIPGLPAADLSNGNASLVFSDGKLNAAISKNLNISTTNVVTKIPSTDPSYTLTIAATTGDVSGTFVHSDGTKPAFKAKIIRKGANAGAYGFFLTTAPKVVDGTGQSGGVSLNHK